MVLAVWHYVAPCRCFSCGFLQVSGHNSCSSAGSETWIRVCGGGGGGGRGGGCVCVCVGGCIVVKVVDGGGVVYARVRVCVRVCVCVRACRVSVRVYGACMSNFGRACVAGMGLVVHCSI